MPALDHTVYFLAFLLLQWDDKEDSRICILAERLMMLTYILASFAAFKESAREAG
jgi:hypothetical protein